MTGCLISSLHLYCNAVLAGLPASTLAPFQRVLHAAARLVLNLRPRDHVSAALKELHWLPVAQRIDYKLCLLVHKSSRGQAPEYISNTLKPVANDSSLTMLRVLQQTGTTSSPAPTVGLVTEHFLSLLLKPGTVYPQTSRSLPAQRTLSNDA